MVDVKGISNRLSEHSVRQKQLETQFMSAIKTSIPETEYDFWFEPFLIGHINFNEHYIMLLVESSVHADWICIKYGDLLFESLIEITGEEYSMQIEVYDEDVSY